MLVETVFIVVAAILFIGFLGEVIFERTKIPDVVWLLIIGIVLASVLGWVTSVALKDVAPFFTTFALIFLLFEAGINIDIKKFFSSASQGMRLSILSFVFSFGIIFVIMYLLGKGLVLSLLSGSILAGISSAVVLPMVRGISIGNETRLALIFDSAFSDVLCILGTVTVIEIFTTRGVTTADVANSVLASFLIAILVGTVCALVWSKILKKLRGRQYILTLAIMLFVYSGTQLLNANGAIAGLVFGLILGNLKKISSVFVREEQMMRKKQVITRSGREFYSEVAFFIKTFFFVYLGILIDFSQPLSFLIAFLILVGVYAVRPFAVFLSFGRETHLRDIKFVEVLIPKGLAAAVLVQLPIEAGIAGASSLVNVALGVVFLSIVSSTIFVYFVDRNSYGGLFKFLYRRYVKR